MSADEAGRLPFAIAADQDDAEMVALIESWRYRGPDVPWTAVVGHAPQIRRCREIVEALRRSEADLERLHIRLGKGIVLTGQPGTGKTTLAKAVASDVGRPVVTPPVSELTPGLIARLYAQLGRSEPVIVVLDGRDRGGSGVTRIAKIARSEAPYFSKWPFQDTSRRSPCCLSRISAT